MNGAYVLESGNFSIGVGAETDCRAETLTEQKCKSFALALSQTYSAVCNAACGVWSTTGVCGSKVGYSECVDTCLASGEWSWNYVECLQNTVIDACQSDFMCYDAFGTSEVPIPDECDGADNNFSHTEVILISCLVGAAGILLGFLVSYACMRWHMSHSGGHLKRELLPTSSEHAT